MMFPILFTSKEYQKVRTVRTIQVNINVKNLKQTGAQLAIFLPIKFFSSEGRIYIAAYPSVVDPD